jgi:hypothetical protein
MVHRKIVEGEFGMGNGGAVKIFSSWLKCHLQLLFWSVSILVSQTVVKGSCKIQNPRLWVQIVPSSSDGAV